MGISQNFQTHLDSGTTTLARCWQIARRDGMVLGFTDHDLDLSFAGTLFKAGTGLTAQTLEQATGLSVDNSEAIGALSDAAITETDIAAGRFDAIIQRTESCVKCIARILIAAVVITA